MENRIDNCKGTTTLNTEIVEQREFTHEFQVEASAQIVSDLEAKFGFRDGEVESQEFKVPVEVPQHTTVMYSLVIKEVWEQGQVEITEQQIPFRVKTGLVHEFAILDSQTCK